MRAAAASRTHSHLNNREHPRSGHCSTCRIKQRENVVADVVIAPGLQPGSHRLHP